MATRRARNLLLGAVVLLANAPTAAQPPALSRDQRGLLQAVVQAVDAASGQPATPDARLTTHVLRASDGSHYVAFGIEPPADTPLPAGPLVLYVRLAAASPSVASPAERSAVREWLAGKSAAPAPWFSRSGIVVGDMPAFGASANLSLRPFAVQGSTDLQVISVERERERRRQEDQARQRRAELEGAAQTTREVMPFEDFDLTARPALVGATRRIERALTAGPGAYALSVGWADPAATDPAATIRVVKTSLALPAATADSIAISSVILADGVRVREAPYQPSEQAAHPYAIGLTEITPARDAVLATGERLAVAFQIINARASEAGKPEVEAALRIVRVTGGLEEPVATLTPQLYSAASVPANFDLRLGHPLLAAITAPVDSLRRGSYRLKIDLTDRLTGRTAAADTDFSIAATATSLLREAPPPAVPFDVAAALSADVLSYVVRTLQPVAPSPALRRALDAVAAARFTDLLDEPVTEAEEGVRAALRGIALLAVDEGSSAVHFQRAQLLGAPRAPARLLSGAARAVQGRDDDAIAAWQEALTAGAPPALVAPFLLDAYVRRSDYARASTLLAATVPAPATSTWRLAVAALLIGTAREVEATPLLETHLTARPDDAGAQWLRLHALYAQIARGDTAPRAAFVSQARAYIDNGGTHAALAADWLALVQPDR